MNDAAELARLRHLEALLLRVDKADTALATFKDQSVGNPRYNVLVLEAGRANWALGAWRRWQWHGGREPDWAAIEQLTVKEIAGAVLNQPQSERVKALVGPRGEG